MNLVLSVSELLLVIVVDICKCKWTIRWIHILKSKSDNYLHRSLFHIAQEEVGVDLVATGTFE